MCLGVPMIVLSADGARAVVEGCGERRVVSTLLVGELTPGTAVLVHVDDAVRVLDPAEVGPITQAILALEMARRGEDVDAMFPDLAGREPELPLHLRPRLKETR